MGSDRFYPVREGVPTKPAIPLGADDDVEAVELVRLGRELTDCELWCGKRKVAFIPRGGAPVIWSTRG